MGNVNVRMRTFVCYTLRVVFHKHHKNSGIHVLFHYVVHFPGYRLMFIGQHDSFSQYSSGRQ